MTRLTADLSRYTVAPGLIDCHTHLIGDPQNSPLAPLERSGGSRFVMP